MKSKLICRLLFIALFHVLFGFGQGNNLQGTANVVDTIPFELTSHNNLVVEAVINKTDTLDIMLHTAANGVSIIREHSEKMKSILWKAPINVGSWGGNGESRYSKANTLKISKTVFDNIEVWENNKSGQETEGKFGLDLFEDYAIEINFDKGLIILYDALPSKIDKYKSSHIERKGNLLFVQGKVLVGELEYQQDFLIHSGYAGALLVDDDFTSKAQLAKHIEVISEQELKDSFGNTVKIKKGKLSLFKLAETSFYDVPLGFFDGTIGRQKMSVLGANIIKRFNVILSKNRDVLYLMPSRYMDNSFIQSR